MRFAREAWPFVLPFWALGALALALGHPGWALGLLVAGLLVLLFFRDPDRAFAGDPGIVVSAADGVITKVDRVEDPDLGPGSFQRVVTFLSAFDVHVQRTPVEGEVVGARYTPGRKVAAFRDDADRVNEKHLTILRRANGDTVGVCQIAGLVARRVVCSLGVGEAVPRGRLMGLIKFGSRVDVMVPAGYTILVQKGQRLRNGETPIARPPAGS